MSSWTDDGGVTHAATAIIATCGCVVANHSEPGRFDEPERMLTCLSCVVGGGSVGEVLKTLDYLDAINTRMFPNKVHEPLEPWTW